MVDPLLHYSNPLVKREVFNFSKARWVALFGRTMVRHDGDKPLTFSSEEDVLEKARRFNARTIYATASKYEVVDRAHVEQDKVVAYTPFFDVDTKIDKWEYAVRAADAIVSFLEKEKVYKSVYLLWSGEGIHVRVNERALPKDYYPVTAAHALVQYVLKRVKNDIRRLSEQSGGVLKVDELIDAKRIFTAPLSLHKELDYVAVCFSPDKLSKFSLEWAKPGSFIHEERAYERYEEDEAKELLVKAIQEYSPYHEGIKAENNDKEEVEGKLGRFQVMGLLQAARYYALYGDLDKAKSFGLNRAIFYAWAKYYGRGYAPKGRRGVPSVPSEFREDRALVTVAGEQVYQEKETGYFVIGDKAQTPRDYDREIKDKVSATVPYDVAWESALKYVSSFPKEVLENQREFYERVYLPVRDKFVEKVVKRKGSLDAFLQ